MHKRFLHAGKPKKKILTEFPHPSKYYYDFFMNDVQKNYSWINTVCPCKNNNDEIISNVDRYGVVYPLVLCKSCGLIRGKKYLRTEDLKDFYSSHYRNVDSEDQSIWMDPKKFFTKQFKESSKIIEIINKYGHFKPTKDKIVADIGGGCGGLLKNYLNKCQVILLDYYEPFLKYAQTVGIKVINGGFKELNKLKIKPDLIILSGVIEHMDQLQKEIDQLINLSKKNQTLVYTWLPGVDSIKQGRRDGDFLGDIHIPHIYYFGSYVFNNFMERNGFKNLYLDSEIKGLYVYTGEKKELKNYYSLIKKDLLLGERKRKIVIVKKFLKLFVPNFILGIKRKYSKTHVTYQKISH